MTVTLPFRPTSGVPYQTAADFVHDLGDIPLQRIIFNPWPGTATEEDLLRKVDIDKHLCELIEGTLVEKAMGWLESMIASKLNQLLLNFVQSRKLGVVAGEAGMIRLSRRLVRIPDISFISYSRFPGGKMPRESIMPVIPDLAVEILSKTNTPREMDRKTAEYFQAGVSSVWLIDPATRSACIYNSPDHPEEIPEQGFLQGAGPLQGFSVPLRELFAVVDEVP